MNKAYKRLFELPRIISPSVIRLHHADFIYMIDNGNSPDWGVCLSPINGCIAIATDDHTSLQLCRFVNPYTGDHFPDIDVVDSRLLAEIAYHRRAFKTFFELASDPDVYEHLMELEPVHTDAAGRLREMRELLRVTRAKDSAIEVLWELGL